MEGVEEKQKQINRLQGVQNFFKLTGVFQHVK